jgi:hypothetical protein
MPSPIQNQDATLNPHYGHTRTNPIQLRGDKDRSQQLLSPKNGEKAISAAFFSDDLILADLEERLAEAREMLGDVQQVGYSVEQPMVQALPPPQIARKKGITNKTAMLAPSKLPERVAIALPQEKAPKPQAVGTKKMSKRQLRESVLRLSTCNTCSTLAKIRSRVGVHSSSFASAGKTKSSAAGATARMNGMRIGTPACPPGGAITSTEFQMPRSPSAPDGVQIDIHPSWRSAPSAAI